MKVKYWGDDDLRVFKATQWFKHGDHPAVGQMSYNPVKCTECGQPYLMHGWFGARTVRGIAEKNKGHYVHPGDWILEHGVEAWTVSKERFETEFREVKDV